MFVKYQSITSTKRDDYVQHVSDLHGDQPAFVFEKIHGANYQICTTEASQVVGRRQGALKADEDFYGDTAIRTQLLSMSRELFQHMKDATFEQEKQARIYSEALRQQGAAKYMTADRLYEELKPSVDPDFKQLTIRGELYGGNYPNAAKVPNVAKVGKGGIHYSQTCSFAVFQIDVDGVVLPFVDAKALCMAVGFPTVPCVFSGTFDSCVEFSKVHKSDLTQVPNGHPEVDANQRWLEKDGKPFCLTPIVGNEREGHVIRFKQPKFLDDGREIIFKDINPTHAEVKHKTKGTKPITVPEELATIIGIVGLGITKARLETMFSYEIFTRRDIASCLGKLVGDTLGEMCSADECLAGLYDALNTKQRKRVGKELNRLAYTELREDFMGMCDGA